MEHSGFPSDESLAAFIDGRLDDVTRRRVIEHMTSCDECYAVYLAATEMQKAAGAAPPRRRVFPRHFWAATLSISIAAVLSVILLRPHSGIDTLAAAAHDLDYRTVDGRLSGFNAYKPLNEIKRATPADAQKEPDTWELFKAVAEVRKAGAKNDESAERLHALGVSHLLLGNWDEAITPLQAAEGKGPHNAAVINDLATAYLARATYKERYSDYVEAAGHAKRAWDLKKTPETAWTRAVAFEHIYLQADARAAWNDYLALDSKSAWSREAATRVRSLGGPTDAEKWEKEKPLLERAAIAGNTKELARIADAFPAQAAEVGEEQLNAWANGKSTSFDAAERVAAAVAPHGFGYLQSACVALRAASPEQLEITKRAMRELERGHTLQGDGEYAAAHQALASARELALRARSPLAQLALLHLAAVTYNENDYVATTNALDALSKEIDPAVTVYRARIDWLRGLIQVESGHPYDGLRSYQRAAELARAAGHRDWEAKLEALIGQGYQILGDPEKAWEHRLNALRLAMKSGSQRRVQYVLMEATIAAVFYEHRRELGDVLTRRLLEVSHGLKVSTAVADAHIWRSRYLRDNGDSGGALNELRRAQLSAGVIADDDARDRLMANLEMAEGELLAHDQPKAAVARLTQSLRFLDRSGNHLLRAQVYSARASAYDMVSDRKEASLDRERGIAEVEAQRGRISDEQLRTAFVAAARRLYTEEIERAVTSGDYARAFDLTERSRASTVGVAPAVGLERLSQVLPVGVALVEYAALKNRTVAWIVRREGVTATVFPSDGEAISAAAERLIAARTDRRSFDVAAADLYKRVITPVRPHVASANIIVFVSEPSWTHFPFAALLDPSRRRFLFEDVAVTTAPSAARLAGVIASAAGPRGAERVLAWTDPEAGDAPRLAAARREGELIGRTFPGAAVISGNAATRDGFITQAQSATLIHFAGHARNDARDRDYSALVFSGDGRSDSGLLYAWEVRELDLTHTRLVVLAACGTDAISDAFLAAGAPATIATLWDIGDTHGRELMSELYGRLHDGDSPSHALRTAQLAVLHDPGSRPADWAGYELVGL